MRFGAFGIDIRMVQGKRPEFTHLWKGEGTMRVFLLLVFLLVLPLSAFAAEKLACSETLDVIGFKDSSFEMAGDVVAEDEDSITLIPENGGRIKLRRELIDDIQYDVREPQQVGTSELVEDFTYCVSRFLATEKEFRIAKITPQSVYLSFGSTEGARPGFELNVYREDERISDPETGKTLGREKNFLGTVQIITVEDEYSKAVPINMSAGEFQEGDIAVFLRKSPVLAVVGIRTLDGEESPYGSLLSEEIIGKLKENPELKIVERRELGQVLHELAIQSAVRKPKLTPGISPDVQEKEISIKTMRLGDGEEQIADEDIADKLQLLRGADALILGTVAEVQGGAAVNLRVVDTSTAAVFVSTYRRVAKPEKPISSAGQKEKKRLKEAVSTQARGQPVSRPTETRGDFLDRILRAIYQR